uniref:C2H2-type domain-containing protein n=1 Tax=viral metagenome TaxID=1070528 RepID=A0A6C0C2Y5_9ZZZZ
MTILKSQKNYQEYLCEHCDYKCYHSNNFNKHLMTLKHKNNENTTIKSLGKYPEYFCILCDYKCSNKKDYNKHLMTLKHKNKEKNPIKIPKEYKCQCGKNYKHAASLHNHKRKCNHTSKENEIICTDNNINLLMNELQRRDEEHKKQFEEQQRQHKEEIEKLSSQISKISTVTNNKTTNNNNKFNLNFFLNTQCKDAMSIQSFMENLKLGCKELEHMGDVGYLNGMIDIFNNTIGNMDVYKRPLHCTDLKREVLYFKQGNDWEKDSEDKKHLKKLIKNVESKNYDNLQEWQKDHPGSLQCDSRDSEHYMKIATEALGGADSNKDSIYLTKIMKHIVKDVHVKP